MASAAVTEKSDRRRRGLEISARTAGASKTIEVEVDKPLGLTLGQKPGGGVVITVSLLIPYYSIISTKEIHFFIGDTSMLCSSFPSSLGVGVGIVRNTGWNGC